MAKQLKSESKYPSSSWEAWVHTLDSLKNDINSLIMKREIWRIYSETSLEYSSNSEGINSVCDWINRNYVDSMLIGLRRLSDKRGSSRSVVTFLNRLKADLDTNNSLINIENVRSVFVKTGDEEIKETKIKRANDAFQKFSKDGERFNVNKIDIHTQKIRTNPLLDLIDYYIAHRNKIFDIDTQNFTYKDLHNAFDLLTCVFNEYYYLLSGSVVSFDSVILRPGLKEVFSRIFNENSQ